MSRQKRSSTGHVLLPASEPPGTKESIPFVPSYDAFSWTFGRGTVIWNIWPAVALHTLFAAVVTSISLTTEYYLAVPPVLITVLGVVIGFVIAYRASSGYDRYWMGRCCWSDLIKTTRTMSRLIWIHVPLQLNAGSEDKEDKEEQGERTALRVMREKRVALDLMEGYLVAIKHHLRGEMGIYYEDLHPLVKPFHNHIHNSDHRVTHGASEAPHSTSDSTAVRSPQPGTIHVMDSKIQLADECNGYGTFIHRKTSRSFCGSGSTECAHEAGRPFLFPSATPNSNRSRIHADLVPFSAFFSSVGQFVSRAAKIRRGEKDLVNSVEQDDSDTKHIMSNKTRMAKFKSGSNRKFKPAVAGGGENLPLEILRCLTEWVAVLDSRDVVPGNAMGGLYSCLTAYEDSLTALERILTTPLPFIYSAHIRQCVWTYLFLLPFQLVDQFGWSTIPGVGVAAFFYLGFLAAGEEIEQPFGYDENDLPLNLFCHEIVQNELESLRHMHCKNSIVPSHDQSQSTLVDGHGSWRHRSGIAETALDDPA